MTDLVVVGLGAAGASAALEANARGAEVLVLERASGGGGASALSEGLLYLGGGTEVQRACGHQDDAEQMYAFLRASIPGVDEERLRSFCDGSSAHFDWLESHGVPFERRELTSKAVAGRDGEGLLVTGNEYGHPFRDLTPPVPRGHQVRASVEVRGGAMLMRRLLAAVEDAGVPRWFDARVTGLMVEDGRVIGVRVLRDRRETVVRARSGVLLATGSFTLNEALVAEHLPSYSRAGTPLGTPDNDGAGLDLGRSAGAALQNMGGAVSTAPIYPPEQLLRGIVVNGEGRRFVAEDAYSGRLADAIERQPGQRAYLVVDEEAFAYPEARDHPLLGVWDSVDDLAEEVGLCGSALVATLASYNEGVEVHRADPEFGKTRTWLRALHPPFAVFDLSFDSTEYRFMTLGGLRTDAHGRCLDDTGAPVAGLYAAGACAAHLPRTGAEYASGLSLGPGTFFARRAAAHALREGAQPS